MPVCGLVPCIALTLKGLTLLMRLARLLCLMVLCKALAARLNADSIARQRRGKAKVQYRTWLLNQNDSSTGTATK